jgi:glutathione S-transferase
MTMKPILWSFRRCPYAMRARLALASSEVPYEHREILLRDKPVEFLTISPKATVPVMQTGDRVIDESLDIMLWALEQNDPQGWLLGSSDGSAEMRDLIAQADGPFKTALDRYKYASRDIGAPTERANAATFLLKLNDILGEQPFLFGARPTLPDMAILPFVRQFAHVDIDWFAAQNWDAVIGWLDAFKSSERFGVIMKKYPTWASAHTGAKPT